MQHLPDALQDRLATEGLEGTQVIRFRRRAGAGGRFVHRTHPLVSLLADHVLETALDPDAGESPVVRCAALFTTAVATVTTVWLLRVRSQITVKRRDRERNLLAEEAITLVSEGERLLRPTPEQGETLLAAEPAANMTDGLCARHVRNALSRIEDWMPRFEQEAQTLAKALLEDHRRVRRASDATGRYRVEPVLPVDVMGVYVLVPFRG